jgi:magnesium-transporting ATPase (P-type)
LEALKDPMLIVLLILAVVSIVLGVAFPEKESDRKWGWVEGAAIITAVMIVSVVTAVNDWQKERKFRELSKESDDIKIKIVRDGGTTTTRIGHIVVGDIVEVEQGDQVPGDGIAFEYHDLKCDESVMTGEPNAIKKNEEEEIFLNTVEETEKDSLNRKEITKELLQASRKLSRARSILKTQDKPGISEQQYKELKDLAEDTEKERKELLETAEKAENYLRAAQKNIEELESISQD